MCEWLRFLDIWRLWERAAWPGKCGKLISTLHLHGTSGVQHVLSCGTSSVVIPKN